HRRVLAGPVAEVVTDPVRVGLVPVGSALRPPAALIGLPDGTRSGAGVWLRTAEVLGEGRGDVEGTRCACGAFVHPLTVLCAACHQVLRPPRRLVVEPTVPVARVVLDDARVLPLCGSVLIGREPAADPLVGEGRVAALALTDSQRSVSRAHAVLWVDGWDVVLEDRQAANGTAVRPPSSAGWTVLVPGGSVRLLPETEVQIGRRTFRLTT
ncbi:FHA domain-containing protein, partial [Euzebya sp.]|uniref:FHA domain-containing protein n=1 Tax=Euzebya sp. TaxID=1971409 RepID=UPI00351265F4